MSDVPSVIRAAIDDHGPITFAEFMELALYGSGGFYEQPPIGASGDFVTSPHVHPVFGELMARALRELWTSLGSPEPFHVVEVGAGDGTLARQILGSLHDVPSRYTAVEISAGARTSLASIERIEVASEAPPRADVVLAHEVLDNLPFRVVRGDREVRIATDGDGLHEELVAIDDDLRAEMAAVAAADGDVVVPVGISAFVDRVATMIDPGFALLVDYGDLGTTGGAIHGYRRHRVVGDVIRDPGSADITSGVDLSLVAARARGAGLQAFGPISQRQALGALGFESWLRDELARQRAQLADGRGIEAVRTWSDRSRATLLVDPAALGRMRWIVLASAELDEPSWIAEGT
ncbi:MAG TPA: SAM-dependent methyltransferase [Actinomycetota bacterium]|nr:SAM-dependent methyltransferase [Actinomycetota bacterium]